MHVEHHETYSLPSVEEVCEELGLTPAEFAAMDRCVASSTLSGPSPTPMASLRWRWRMSKRNPLINAIADGTAIGMGVGS